MRSVADLLERITEWIMAAMLAIMVGLVFSNVVLRYIFSSGIVAAEEIARLMFVWLVFLGATVALRHQRHLGLEILQSRLPFKVRRACAVISHLMILYALYLFVQGSWIQLLIGMETFSTVLRFPMAIYAAAGFFPAIAMTLIVLANLWRIVTNQPGARIPGDPDTMMDHPESHGPAVAPPAPGSHPGAAPAAVKH
ncbi:TRAP-type C4-dicarboxylate transport system permease small subunit [Azospirillum lipoferum]|uniref:TRAP transporter small permease protein n=1 Tax=Azospirillum lipoferum TaxID=193 RepID=A0A5A9GQM9_AZOLI|nr:MULTISPECIES: TRAP transporter small permease [Azospirillum]KAA0596670.1 TRAP transporter small permease [Azospirillum lipoferum]MCP1610686.1 TRAP-type C4-dicarboxylate transport system permease small subunit [Azospirillum lipoferum]MDW5537870.1 TRAP transporter small permease [Azospirillum sp. NL1]